MIYIDNILPLFISENANTKRVIAKIEAKIVQRTSVHFRSSSEFNGERTSNGQLFERAEFLLEHMQAQTI